MTETVDLIEIRVNTKTKTLTCKDTLVLCSRCKFTIVDETGKKLPIEGAGFFRVLRPEVPRTARVDEVYGVNEVACFGITDGESGETSVMKDAALIGWLGRLPDGSEVSLRLTIVSEAGVIGLGEVTVLVPTIVESGINAFGENRAALFRGSSGVQVLDEPPDETLDDDVVVAVNLNGKGETVYEVPPCPADLLPPEEQFPTGGVPATLSEAGDAWDDVEPPEITFQKKTLLVPRTPRDTGDGYDDGYNSKWEQIEIPTAHDLSTITDAINALAARVEALENTVALIPDFSKLRIYSPPEVVYDSANFVLKCKRLKWDGGNWEQDKENPWSDEVIPLKSHTGDHTNGVL